MISTSEIWATESLLLCYCCLNRKLFISALLMVVMTVSLHVKRSSYYKNSRHSVFWAVLHTATSTIRGLTTFFHLILSPLFNEILMFLHYCVISFNQIFINSTTLFLLKPPDKISRGNMHEFHDNKPLIWVLMDTVRYLWWFLMDATACNCCLVSTVSSILVLLWYAKEEMGSNHSNLPLAWLQDCRDITLSDTAQEPSWDSNTFTGEGRTQNYFLSIFINTTGYIVSNPTPAWRPSQDSSLKVSLDIQNISN